MQSGNSNGSDGSPGRGPTSAAAIVVVVLVLAFGVTAFAVSHNGDSLQSTGSSPSVDQADVLSAAGLGRADPPLPDDEPDGRLESAAAEPGQSDSYLHLVARRREVGGMCWFEFDYPSSWILASSVAPISVASKERGVHGCRDCAVVDVYCGDPSNLPPDLDAAHTTDTIMVDGRVGVHKTRETETGAQETLRVNAASIDYLLMMAINAATAESERELQTEVAAVIDSFDIIEPQVSTADWISSSLDSAADGLAASYTVRHPKGWDVFEDMNGALHIDGPAGGPYAAGPVSIVVTPGNDHAGQDWATASETMYAVLGRETRLLSEEVVEGRSEKRYLIDVAGRRWRVDVSVPTLQAGSDEYWLYDQTAWLVLTWSGVALESAPAPAYP